MPYVQNQAPNHLPKSIVNVIILRDYFTTFFFSSISQQVHSFTMQVKIENYLNFI